MRDNSSLIYHTDSEASIKNAEEVSLLYSHLDCAKKVKFLERDFQEYLISIGEDSLLICYNLETQSTFIARSHISPLFSLSLSSQCIFSGGWEGWVK